MDPPAIPITCPVCGQRPAREFRLIWPTLPAIGYQGRPIGTIAVIRHRPCGAKTAMVIADREDPAKALATQED